MKIRCRYSTYGYKCLNSSRSFGASYLNIGHYFKNLNESGGVRGGPCADEGMDLPLLTTNADGTCVALLDGKQVILVCSEWPLAEIFYLCNYILILLNLRIQNFRLL